MVRGGRTSRVYAVVHTYTLTGCHKGGGEGDSSLIRELSRHCQSRVYTQCVCTRCILGLYLVRGPFGTFSCCALRRRSLRRAVVAALLKILSCLHVAALSHIFITLDVIMEIACLLRCCESLAGVMKLLSQIFGACLLSQTVLSILDCDLAPFVTKGRLQLCTVVHDDRTLFSPDTDAHP